MTLFQARFIQWLTRKEYSEYMDWYNVVDIIDKQERIEILLERQSFYLIGLCKDPNMVLIKIYDDVPQRQIDKFKWLDNESK